jgi:hypothetical protein
MSCPHLLPHLLNHLPSHKSENKIPEDRGRLMAFTFFTRQRELLALEDANAVKNEGPHSGKKGESWRN